MPHTKLKVKYTVENVFHLFIYSKHQYLPCTETWRYMMSKSTLNSFLYGAYCLAQEANINESQQVNLNLQCGKATKERYVAIEEALPH